jgi:hypothetical protein
MKKTYLSPLTETIHMVERSQIMKISGQETTTVAGSTDPNSNNQGPNIDDEGGNGEMARRRFNLWDDTEW